MKSKPGAVIFQEADLVRADVPATGKKIRTFGTSRNGNPDDQVYYGKWNACMSLDNLYIFEQNVPSNFPAELKKSLSKVLSLFPTFAGRLDPKTIWVVCNNQGAAFTIKYHDGHARDVEHIPNRLKYQNFPSPQLIIKGDQPLLSVTIHMFNEGGAVFACNVSHSVVDAAGFALFLDAWSTIHRGEKVDENFIYDSSVFEKKLPKDYRKSILQDEFGFSHSRVQDFFFKHIMCRDRASVRAQKHEDRVVVTFSKDQCQRLKSEVVQRMKEIGHQDGWCSTGEALRGFFHCKILDLLDVPMSARTNLGQSNDIDVRGRTEFPQTYIGNAVFRKRLPLNLNVNHWSDLSISIHDKLRTFLSNSERLSTEFHCIKETISKGEVWQPTNSTNVMYVLESVNSQLNIDYITPSDFGFGIATRFVPWMIGETCKMIRNANGDVELHISTKINQRKVQTIFKNLKFLNTN